MIEGKCLFSAPFSFMSCVYESYNNVIKTEFKEIWKSNEIEIDLNVVAWVMNPGQKFFIDKDILDRMPNLKVLSSPSTGVNHIDIDECKQRNIAVYCLLDDRAALETISASAEFTFLLLLNTLRRLDLSITEVNQGRWREREDQLRGNELYGKRVGLIGLGRIGRRLARYCTAFDSHVTYYDPYVDNKEYLPVSLEEVFEYSDVIVICPYLTKITRGMVDRPLLSRMKKGACLINTSRGEVVNENDLKDFIMHRDDVRVAVDVVIGEGQNVHYESPLIELHKQGYIIVTPHIAGATIESQEKAANIALDLLRSCLSTE